MHRDASLLSCGTTLMQPVVGSHLGTESRRTARKPVSPWAHFSSMHLSEDFLQKAGSRCRRWLKLCFAACVAATDASSQAAAPTYQQQ